MKRRGRPTKLNAELTRQICELLSEGISIGAVCDALGINQDTYFSWIKKDAEFSEQTARARANGKIALVRRVLADKDWRAISWYLSVCWPNEFARTVERPLPKEEQERATVAFILNSKEGARQISFSQAQARFGNFPVSDESAPAQVTADNDEDFRYFERHGIVRIRPEQNGDGDET